MNEEYFSRSFRFWTNIRLLENLIIISLHFFQIGGEPIINSVSSKIVALSALGPHHLYIGLKRNLKVLVIISLQFSISNIPLIVTILLDFNIFQMLFLISRRCGISRAPSIGYSALSENDHVGVLH